MGARILGNLTIAGADSVTTDSRTDVAGSLFFALRGATFDGHEFVNDVLARGAAAAVVSDIEKIDRSSHDKGRLLFVGDTTAALGKLAMWYRRQSAAQVIAVVGSNGKTTAKDLIHAVLGSQRPGRAAKASFNNSIGVPLTLLSVEPKDEYVVVEIGTNHPGEIGALGRIAQPDMVVVTSIGEEHLEFFGNVESVAREEYAILNCMQDRAFVAVSDQAAPFAPPKLIRDRSLVVYGFANDAQLRVSGLVAKPTGQTFKVNGRFDYSLPLLGRHNVLNAMAAIAVGTRFRMSEDAIAAALAKVRPSPMRMETRQFGELRVINDAYNANPTSMRAAFEVLDSLDDGRRKVLIMGDMRELGNESARCHQAVGRDAGRSTAQVIIAVGAFARVVVDGATTTAGTNKRIYAFQNIESLIGRLHSLIEPHDTVLLKASRGMGLERLLEHLQQLATNSVSK